MTEEARTILTRFEVRKSPKQKEAFREYLRPLLRRRGYAPETAQEKGLGRSRNIVVGDPETARLIFTAHYDTCAVLPIPNFITPRNLLWYGLYQALLVLLVLALCVAAEVAVLMLWPDAPLAAALGAVYLMLAFCLWWMLDGKANRHTANDNTSGGAVLTETVFAMPGLGKLMVDSINGRDYSVVQGGVLIIAIMFSLVNLVVDILYAYADPRIKSNYV